MSPRRPSKRTDLARRHVVLGRVVASRGLSGELQVEPFTDVLAHFEPGRRLWLRGEEHAVEQAHRRRDHVVLKLSGVDSPEAAAELRGEDVSLPEALLEPLPEGQYYRFQIVGMEVRDGEGRLLGTVREVLATGSNDVYIVSGDLGEVLVPAIDDVVKEVDLAAGRIVVDLMDGMLPRPKEERLP